MPLSFIKDSVTVIRPVVSVKNGQTYFDWENATQTTLKGVQVTAQSTSRDYNGRILNVSDRRTLRARYDADIRAGDRVIYEGETYDVEGEVFHTKSPTGRVSSTRCTLARWDG